MRTKRDHKGKYLMAQGLWNSKMQFKMNHIQEDLSRKQQIKTKVVAYDEV
jgi:hypothetical protein